MCSFGRLVFALFKLVAFYRITLVAVRIYGSNANTHHTVALNSVYNHVKFLRHVAAKVKTRTTIGRSHNFVLRINNFNLIVQHNIVRVVLVYHSLGESYLALCGLKLFCGDFYVFEHRFAAFVVGISEIGSVVRCGEVQLFADFFVTCTVNTSYSHIVFILYGNNHSFGQCRSSFRHFAVDVNAFLNVAIQVAAVVKTRKFILMEG